MNGNGPSPGASSPGSTGAHPFLDESESRHMEIASQIARFEDVSARQAWPAVCAGKIVISSCSRRVVQHAAAFVQELQLLDRRIQDRCLAPKLERRVQELQVVRGRRLTMHPAARQPPSNLCCMGAPAAQANRVQMRWPQHMGRMTRC